MRFENLLFRFKSSYKENPVSGCLEWQRPLTSYGYARIHFKGRPQYAHRICWELENGPIPDGLCVCHKCDNRKCGNVDHLFLGTKKDNSLDRIRKGRPCKGRALLTPEQAKEIFESNEPNIRLAERFNISNQAICDIKKGRNWKNQISKLNGIST